MYFLYKKDFVNSTCCKQDRTNSLTSNFVSEMFFQTDRKASCGTADMHNGGHQGCESRESHLRKENLSSFTEISEDALNTVMHNQSNSN